MGGQAIAKGIFGWYGVEGTHKKMGEEARSTVR